MKFETNWKSVRFSFFALAAAAAMVAAAPLGAQGNRISGSIDSSQMATLAGHVPPQARAEFDQGPVDAAFPLNDLSLVLQPSAEQQAALTALLAAQQDAASSDYHNWLTPAQFADRFAPTESDVDQIVAWLEAQGFAIHSVAPSRNWISFGGSAGLAQRAFAVEIHSYQVNGETHFANASDPAVPSALAGVVAAIRGLDDFLPRPPGRQALPAYTSASGKHYLAPEDAATIYNITALYKGGYDGTGQKLVVAGQSAINISDIENFRTVFNLPKNDPQVTLVPGATDPGIVSGDEVEADIDLEWAGAIAKNASVTYVYARNVFDAVQYAVSANLAPVIGLSYGTCETGASATGAALQLLAQQANAQGITWIASSGDSGAAGCELSGAAAATRGPAVVLPASVPEVTGVGGTYFNEGSGTYWNATNDASQGSALSYIPETSWNETATAGTLEASGGGPSVLFSKPPWQAGSGVPSDGARDVPDIAMPAGAGHDGAIVCTGGSCASGLGSSGVVAGGTSLSAQIFAGIATLVNHYEVATGAAAKAGLGNMNPILYALVSGHAEAFHDITTGDNIVPCRTGSRNCTTGSFGYEAGPGYDLVTGLGSVNAYNLATDWRLIKLAPAALSSVEIAPASISGGGSAEVIVNLTGPAPSGGATVTLSSNSAAFPAPAGIVVAAGLFSASVKVQAATVTASTTATVTATYNSVSKTASVTIAPVVPPSLSAIAIIPASVPGGASAMLTVALSGPAPTGGATVTLATSNAAFPVPASIVVASGSRFAGLRVQTTAVTTSTAVTVTATYSGASKTASVTVTPVVPPSLTAVAVTPMSLMGGASAALTVTLSGAAPPGGATVTLTSNNAAFPVPASVLVPDRRDAVSVVVKTTVVTASTPVTVAASYNGASKTASVTVTPVVLPTLTSIALNPTSVTGGVGTVLTVTLSGAAPPSGASVTLSSNNAALTVPASVAIPSGEKSGSVRLRTATVSAAVTATVTASYNNTSATAALTVEPPALAGVAVAPSSVQGGASALLTVSLSGPVPAGGATVKLSSNSAAFPVPASMVVAAGRAGASAEVQTVTVTASTAVTVTATYGGASKTANVTVTPVVLPTVSALDVFPGTVAGGSSAILAVTLSGRAPAGGATVTLSSSNAAFPVPASVAIGSGERAAMLEVKTTAVTAAVQVTVTASYNNSKQTATVTVAPAGTR